MSDNAISPRETFNNFADSLGLKVTLTTTDGWHFSFERADGLILWRAMPRPEGCTTRILGIQTAYLVDGRFSYHKSYFGKDLVEALGKAARRETI